MTIERFRYRVEQPRPDQVVALAQLFGCCRVVSNDVIRAREHAHAAGLPFPKTGDLSKQLITQAKHTQEREYLAEVSAVPLQQALADGWAQRKRSCLCRGSANSGCAIRVRCHRSRRA